MQDFYTLVTDDDKFVYFVSGDVKTDTMPRKSCCFGEDDQDRWMQRTQDAIARQVGRLTNAIQQYGSHYGTEWVKGRQRTIDALNNLSFRVVKVSFTEV